MAGQLELLLVTFKQDSLIIVEGKRDAGCFYIIRQGKVRVSTESELVAEERGIVLGPGDFFGVISTMSSHSHIETVRALSDVILISVRRDQYGEFIHQHPSVALKLVLDFSKRLRRLDEALARFALKDTARTDASHLFMVGDYYLRQSQFPQAYYAYYQYIKHCPGGEYVPLVRERMSKMAARAGTIKLEYDPQEFSRVYPKDSMFFAEGEPGDALYIIQKGMVKISKIVDKQEVVLAVLRGGDIFGEMALLEAKPRTASAMAHEDCMVTVVSRANMERTIQEQPQIIARLTTLQAERIWFIYKHLDTTRIKDPLGRLYEILRIHLEKNRVDLESTQSYVFSFGPRELAGMAGLSPAEGGQALKKLLANEAIITVLKNQLFALNVPEIVRQASYFRTKQKLDNSRRG